MKIIGNISDWLSYAGGALIKVADSAGSTVVPKCIKESCWSVANKFVYSPLGSVELYMHLVMKYGLSQVLDQARHKPARSAIDP